MNGVSLEDFNWEDKCILERIFIDFGMEYVDTACGLKNKPS